MKTILNTRRDSKLYKAFLLLPLLLRSSSGIIVMLSPKDGFYAPYYFCFLVYTILFLLHHMKRSERNLQIEILQTSHTFNNSIPSSVFFLLKLSNPHAEPMPAPRFISLVSLFFCYSENGKLCSKCFNSFFCFLSNIVLPFYAIVVYICYKQVELNFNLATCFNPLLSPLTFDALFSCDFHCCWSKNVCLNIFNKRASDSGCKQRRLTR